MQKVLEDAGIKLASVAAKTLSKSGRARVEALIAGERPGGPRDLAQRRAERGLTAGALSRLSSRAGDPAHLDDGNGMDRP